MISSVLPLPLLFLAIAPSLVVAEDDTNKILEAGLAEKFLEENGKRPGVTTTESGLQYEVLEPGKEDGKGTTSASIVHIHWESGLRSGACSLPSPLHPGKTFH